jgi:hypothetical protein
MTEVQVREQLHKRIDTLPDEIVEQIADFTLFVMARKQTPLSYEEWTLHQWQDFALEQFFREEDDVEYSLADAQEVYEKP